jgi:cytochrome c
MKRASFNAGAVMALAFVLGLATEGSANDLGRSAFEPCRSCHALDPSGAEMPGPNLASLTGRPVGGDPEFDYSPVLRQARAEGHTWTAERLDRFLADPDAMYPGLWMATRGISDAAERQALVRFLSDPQSR